MFILKSFQKLIRDCDEIYQNLNVQILNNGDIKLWMFEEFKNSPDIIPCNCLKTLKSFREALFFQALMDISESEDINKIVDDFIEEIYNEHHKLFANYKFAENGTDNYIEKEANKNAREVETVLWDYKIER